MKTKVIKSGNSQAVRIPAGLRLKSKEVEIVAERGRIVIFDPKELARETARRRAVMDQLFRLGPLEEEWPRP